jgi:hypothetical protein
MVPVYQTASGTVELEVTASDSSGIRLVEFLRWGGPIQQEVEIGTDSSPPYQASLEVNTLNIGENGITAVAEDMAGNRGIESISIYRVTEPGRLRVIKALSMPTTSLFVGENVTVSFTVKNVGGSALHLEELAAGARRGRDWNGARADFPHVSNITLQPNDEYVYQQSRSFDTAGDYFAEPVVKMNGKWGGIENANRISFTVQIPKPVPTPTPPHTPTPTPTPTPCEVTSCVRKATAGEQDHLTNIRRAVSAERVQGTGACINHTESDWEVRYNINHPAWRISPGELSARIRFSAASWRVSPTHDQAQAQYSPPTEIALCLDGLFVSRDDMLNTWLGLLSP